MISLWNFWIPILSFLREAQVAEISSISIMEMDGFDFACLLELSLCNYILWECSSLSWRCQINIYIKLNECIFFTFPVLISHLPYFRFCIYVDMFSFQIINFKNIDFSISFNFQTSFFHCKMPLFAFPKYILPFKKIVRRLERWLCY